MQTANIDLKVQFNLLITANSYFIHIKGPWREIAQMLRAFSGRLNHWASAAVDTFSLTGPVMQFLAKTCAVG